MASLAPHGSLVAGAIAPRFIVAAPASGAGKTVATVAMIAALCERGHAITPAKIGPDYIDTAWLAAAARRPALNLDLWAMRPALIDSLAADGPLVVEGVMGLFDGPVAGEGSTADVARRLGLPIVLVVNAQGQSHSVAALVHGFSTFDPSLTIAGVLLTKVASARHEAMLQGALERAGHRVLGALPRDAALALPSRHLGLHQAHEHAGTDALVDHAAALAKAHVDLAALEALSAPPRGASAPPPFPPLGQRIAVARDAAFTFTYTHVLEGWRDAGASISVFAPLAGEAPDGDADAILLPGGYPELHAGALAAQDAWTAGLTAAAARGALIYGECGGYMALGETLTDAEGIIHRMAGLLPVATSFAQRCRTLGYRGLQHRGKLLPPQLRGHEFHYAVETRREGLPLFDAEDAASMPLGPMGVQRGRVAGSFAHIIDRA